jgi:hypothetical protein
MRNTDALRFLKAIRDDGDNVAGRDRGDDGSLHGCSLLATSRPGRVLREKSPKPLIYKAGSQTSLDQSMVARKTLFFCPKQHKTFYKQ